MQAELGRLLIVDDEPDVAELLHKAAIEVGCLTKIVATSADFEPLVLQWHPTVIILDIVMPERDGIELISALAALGFPGDIIIISGADPRYSRMASTKAKASGLNVGGVLSKPVRKRDFQNLLRLLGQRANKQ